MTASASTRCSSCPRSSRSTPTSRGGSSPGSSAASSSQAGFERAVLGLSGGIDSRAGRVPRGRGDRRRTAAGRADAVPTSSPASRGDAERSSRRWAARASSSRSRRWSTATSGRATGGRRGRGRGRGSERHALRRGNFMARMRMAVAVRPVGDVGRPGCRHRQQDRVADRLHDAVRRHRLRVQPDRRPVQEPGPAAAAPSACPTRSSARRRRPTCGRARPTRARPGSVPRSWTGCSSGGSTSGARSRRWSRSGSTRTLGGAGGPAGGRRRVQAPGPTDREARAADGRRRLPLPAARAGLGAVTAADGSGAVAARHAVRRRDADREPRRRDAASARGPARRPADRRRGHAADPPPARPLRDRGADGQLPRPKAPARDRRLLDHLRAARTSRWSPTRDARGERPGRRAGRGVGRGGRRVPLPGASAVLAAVAVGPCRGPRWSHSRGSCRGRARAAGAAGPEPGRAGSAIVFEAPGRLGATLRDLAGGLRPGSRRRRVPRAHEAARIDRARHARRARGAGGRRIAGRGEIVIVVGGRGRGRELDAAGGRR